MAEEHKDVVFEWCCKRCGEYNKQEDDVCIHCTEEPDREAMRIDHILDHRKHSK